MKLLARIVITIAVNSVALLAASYLVVGFGLAGGFEELITLALVLTVLNAFLKPILKLALGPFILITLGLGLIVVNALILYLLDLWSANLTIQTVPALIYSSIIISAINFILHVAI